jgi:hypothetical protein
MSFLSALGPGPLGMNWLGLLPKKRSIFISYHHDRDQYYYDEFSKLFSETFDIVRDNSVYRIFDSDDPEYVMRRIRENHITGSSCTIVLCGPETRWRKYVDWEIKATLDKNHALIGVLLPHNPIASNGGSHKPDRLQDNIDSGYAFWTDWLNLIKYPTNLKLYIEFAIERSKLFVCKNDRPMRKINGGNYANPLERLFFA